jgi:hypothetical protein
VVAGEQQERVGGKRKVVAERSKKEGAKRRRDQGRPAGKLPQHGVSGPVAEAAGQGQGGASTSSSSDHSQAVQQPPAVGAGEVCSPPSGQAPPADARPGSRGSGPGPACPRHDSQLLAGLTLSHHARQVFELLHALGPIQQFLQPMDLIQFVKLLPKTKDDLALQIMVGMTKHPLFTADLVRQALQAKAGESHTDTLARATHEALVQHSQRIRSQDAHTMLCHVTLDFRISYVTGIAAWCQRLNLISKVMPSGGEATGDSQDALVLGTKGQAYFWTGDTSRLQALVPRLRDGAATQQSFSWA